MSVFVFCTDTVHYGTEHVEMTTYAVNCTYRSVRTPLVDPFPIEEDSSLKVQIEDHFLFSKIMSTSFCFNFNLHQKLKSTIHILCRLLYMI